MTMTMRILQRGSPAPDDQYFSPVITHSSPSRTARHDSCLASDDATSGSVMMYAERISPLSNGSSHRSFCSGVPTRSSTSMFPVSGAEQFRHSDAIGFLPSSTAMYA